MHANSSPHGIDHPYESDSGREVDRDLIFDGKAALRGRDDFDDEIRGEFRIGLFVFGERVRWTNARSGPSKVSGSRSRMKPL